MPRATVQGADGQGGELPPVRTRVVAFGRGRRLVEVLSEPVKGRIFIRVMEGAAKGSTYWLPCYELMMPRVQPPDEYVEDLPHDRGAIRMQPDTFQDEPDSETCPHAVSVRQGTGWSYDEDLGLWVHGDPACRRPSRSQLRNVGGADMGFKWDTDPIG